MGRARITGLSPAEVRNELGVGFAFDFPLRVQERFEVDVLVLDLEGDAYTIQAAQRPVVVLKRTTTWARQNFSLAHELGHIAAGAPLSTSGRSTAAQEAAANAFAAELLMPAADLAAMDWGGADAAVVADLVWRLGVSTRALSVRLESLGISPSDGAADALALSTTSLLRRYWPGRRITPDPITERRERAAARSFPAELGSLLESKVLDGFAPRESLAFLLGVPPDDLEVEFLLPDTSGADAAFLSGLLEE